MDFPWAPLIKPSPVEVSEQMIASCLNRGKSVVPDSKKEMDDCVNFLSMEQDRLIRHAIQCGKTERTMAFFESEDFQKSVVSAIKDERVEYLAVKQSRDKMMKSFLLV